jgi:hypothetical protein
LSWDRVPLSPNQKCEKLWTLPLRIQSPRKQRAVFAREKTNPPIADQAVVAHQHRHDLVVNNFWQLRARNQSFLIERRVEKTNAVSNRP